MPQIVRIRTPIDVELLRAHLTELCAYGFQLDVLGQEDGDLGPRNIVRVEFNDVGDYPMLSEAVKRAHAAMQARGTEIVAEKS